MTIAKDRKALVTGGAQGLGLQIALELANEIEGVAIADVDTSRLREAVAKNPQLIPFEVDVGDSQAVCAELDKCVQQLGGLDTIVNCAAIIYVKPLEDVTDDDWNSVLKVNLTGVFNVCRAAAPVLRASERGRIVSLASGAATRGSALIHAYCASKFGLLGLTQSLAAELAASAVTVNCVSPGPSPQTGMGQMLAKWKSDKAGLSETEIIAAIASSVPLQRCAEATEIAAAVMYLISDEAAYVTGINIDVNGGQHLALMSGSNSWAGTGFTPTLEEDTREGSAAFESQEEMLS